MITEKFMHAFVLQCAWACKCVKIDEIVRLWTSEWNEDRMRERRRERMLKEMVMVVHAFVKYACN